MEPIPTPTQINKNFVIRYKEKGIKKTSLIGAGRYHTLVGDELKNKHFLKAFKNQMDKTTINLRRGLTIVFAPK